MPDRLPQRLARAANTLLHPLGLHLARSRHVFDMDGLLARAARRHRDIGTWVDVGASDGIWSLRARRHFPSARFLLFEPLAEHRRSLEALRQSHGFRFAPCAAGAKAGELRFTIDPALDGSGVALVADVAAPATTRSVPVDTIDACLAREGLSGPYALKLDTHGFEIPVLQGAARTLGSTHLLVIEAYNFSLGADAPRFHELCAWLEARGFRCCDLADPMRRPGDGALWQMDLAFARADDPVFSKASYS